jgi:hypothetical protein
MPTTPPSPTHRQSCTAAPRRRWAWLAALLGLVPAAAAQGFVHDVPHRGALVYTRSTEQFEVAHAQSRLRPYWVIQDGADGHHWRHHAAANGRVPAGFERVGFDDRDWPTGQGAFGPDAGKNPEQRTAWRSDVLCVRTVVDLGTKKPRALQLRVTHDDDFVLYLNGTVLLDKPGYADGADVWITGPGLDAWVRGENTIAAKCTNTGGYQRFALALALHTTLPARAKEPGDLQRTAEEERNHANAVRGDLFGSYRMPPLLLQGDLEAGTHVRLPPADLRDLGWWLAMDLRCGAAGGSVTAEAWRLYRLGDLQVRGRATAVAADGWQTLELTVKNSAEPAPRDDSKRFVDMHVKPHVGYGFDGKLVVRRRVVADGGKVRIAEFTTDLDGRLLRGKDWKDPTANLRHRETWRFVADQPGQDARFRGLVQQAIERGTNRLKQDLANVNAPLLAREAEGADRSYHTGRLSLGLLALVKGGVPKDDPVVVAGFAELRRRVLVDTYSLGNAMMALEALYAPAGEFGDLKAGTIDRPRPRELPADDKKLMQEWVDILMRNPDRSVDASDMLRFHYVGGHHFDNSVNQYGLLGLYSAHLCGIPIAPAVWEAAANHLLASQSPAGEKVDLELVDYRTHARRQAAPDEPVTVARTTARALGWSYHGPKDGGELAPMYGSMTAAGITGLAICQAALDDHKTVKRPKLQSDATRARNDGFAWLSRHMTMRYHGGDIDRQPRWFYYYLYSIERAALLSGVALLADRDWYFEGAMVLIHSQQPDGHWPAELHWDQGIERDAMAILFLKQSTMPVLTGR